MEKFFLEGFLLQASLIFALGAQNIFVLEAGLRKQHHIVVSMVCFLCDLVLILLGVLGSAALFEQIPSLKILIGVMGVYFLFSYGFKRIFDPTTVTLVECSGGPLVTMKRSAILAVTFSILNPHAYLDAFVLIGGYASKYALVEERVALGMGAAIYSGVWFLVISSLSSMMRPVLLNPVRMRAIGNTAGMILILLSGKLAIDVLEWIPETNSSGVNMLIPLGNELRLYSTILF